MIWLLLLSFILLSYIVVLNREIVNIKSFLNISVMSNPVEVNNSLEDINIDKLKGRSMILSHISSRVTLAYLDILYISYVNRMKAQNNNLSWFNQTEQENFQLLYSSLKRGNLVDWNKMVSPTHLMHMLKMRFLLIIFLISSIVLVSPPSHI